MPLLPAYAKEMTLTLFVGLFDRGLTAGGSTRRGKPLPLPLTVGSTQSATGIAGPVYKLLALFDRSIRGMSIMLTYGKRVSTSLASSFLNGGAASVATNKAPRSADVAVPFILETHNE